MEHRLTHNGLSYTCECCHRVLPSPAAYERVACEVGADDTDERPQDAASVAVP